MEIEKFWQAVLTQNQTSIRAYFDKDAVIRWHNTNEQFTVEQFIQANCEYPGSWSGKIERKETIGDLLITVTHVWDSKQTMSFHVTSFIKINKNKIITIDEYWGDDGDVPTWRKDKHIGEKIK